MEDNIYGIEFVAFEIKDYDTKRVIFKVDRENPMVPPHPFSQMCLPLPRFPPTAAARPARRPAASLLQTSPFIVAGTLGNSVLLCSVSVRASGSSTAFTVCARESATTMDSPT